MRTHLTLVLLLTVLAAQAQHFTLSADGGFNVNTPKKVTNKFNYGIGIGWQAGFKAEYSLKHWFVYSGAEVSQQPFRTTIGGEGPSFGPNIDVFGLGRHTYIPTYLTIPFGIGYSINVNKETAIQVYGGFYNAWALGGTVKEAQYVCTDRPACPEPPGIETKHTLRVGNNIYPSQENGLAQTNPLNDLAKTNRGVQFGAGIKLFHKIELLGMYNIGLANISPSKAYGYSMKVNSITVDLKYDIYSR